MEMERSIASTTTPGKTENNKLRPSARLLLEPPDGTYWCTTVARARQMVERAQAPTTPDSRRELFLNAVGDVLDGFPGIPPTPRFFLPSCLTPIWCTLPPGLCARSAF